MVGIELTPQPGLFFAAEVCERIRSYGVILRPLGDVVVWMPPLTITREELGLLESATLSALADVLRVPRETTG